MGFNAAEFVQSPWLKGDMLPKGQRIAVTVKRVDLQKFQDQGEKLVLTFYETDKRLILNKTSIKAMIDIGGEDSDGWVDQPLELYSEPSGYGTTLTIKILPGGVKAPSVSFVKTTPAPAAAAADVVFMK